MGSGALLDTVASIAKAIMGDDPGHGWPHVERVYVLAKAIVDGEGLDVDWVVLGLSVYLHDVGRFLGGRHHVVGSVELARRLLPSLGLEEGVVERVVHAIEAHSYSYGVKPRSIEAKVLSDADKLDALGAIGVARVFYYSCAKHRGFEESLRHFKEKILKLPGIMHFSYSKRLAEERLGIVERFVETMERELRIYGGARS